VIKLDSTAKRFTRTFMVANVTRKSLTCYEDVMRVGRVTRMLQGRYEETAPVEFSLYAPTRIDTRGCVSSCIKPTGSIYMYTTYSIIKTAFHDTDIDTDSPDTPTGNRACQT